LNQGRYKTAFITAVTIDQEQDKSLSRKWSDQEGVFLLVDLKEIDALLLSQSDYSNVQIIEEHVEVGKLDQREEVDPQVTSGNTDHTLKQTVSLKPISSVSLKSVIDSC